MRIRCFVGLILVFMFSGCTDYKDSSTAQNQDADLPTYVRNSDLSDYWVVQNTSLSFDLPNALSPTQNGEVEVGFIIDVNGHTSNFEIVRSMPDGLWDEQAKKGAKQLKFVSAAKHAPQNDIYTTWKFEFTADQKQ